MNDDARDLPRRVEIIDRQRLVDDFFQLDAVHYRVERYDGGFSDPVRRLVLERGDSVAALLVDGDTAWLVEQFRIAAHERGDGWLLELAAGMVSPGETPEAALRREVLEETGFELAGLQPLGRFYLSPGGSSEHVHVYLAHIQRRVAPGGGLAAEGEDIRLVPFSRDGLRDAWRQGRLVDAKTLIAVMQWLGNVA